MTGTDTIEQLANAVLYEGFYLYPYRPSSVKNRHRWNFGVVAPQPYATAHGEKSFAQTECLMVGGADTAVSIKVRFLQLIGGAPVEREIIVDHLAIPSHELVAAHGNPPQISRNLEAPSGFKAEQESLHDVLWENGRIQARLSVATTLLGGMVNKIKVRLDNRASHEGSDRDEALAMSLISLHVILTLTGGRFISLIDPEERFHAAAAACENVGLWPVLADREDSQMLASPIILPDHPQVASQSPGDLFDATEIDEILSLRIRTMTDAEKAEAREADPRVRALLDRTEALSREELFQLHASMRGQAPGLFRVGDRVRLRPRRRADIFDIALAGKLATVVSVRQDFENAVHVCVTVDDDPGKDLGAEGKPGHRFFFGLEELEPA